MKKEDQTLDCGSASYVGLSKIAPRRDEPGFTRMAINDQFSFEVEHTLDRDSGPKGNLYLRHDRRRCSFSDLRSCKSRVIHRESMRKGQPDRLVFTGANKLGC